MTFYFGSHIKNNENVYDTILEVKKAGGNFIQLFPPKRTDRINTYKLKNFLKINNMKCVVHSSYIHNIAKKIENDYDIYHKELQSETKYAEDIGAIGIVIHFGKQLDLPMNEALNNMYLRLLLLYENTKNYKSKLILETSTGQGTELCHKLEDLAYFYRKISLNRNKQFSDRVKLCIDTCHIFSAGYNIKDKYQVDRYLEKFDFLIGLNNVVLIHLNDSKVKLGERKDRHENIGEGYIGIWGLKYFVSVFKLKNVPIVMETPGKTFEEEIRIFIPKKKPNQ